jgi:hypothetical protein
MANTTSIALLLRLTTGLSAIELRGNLSETQVGTAFDRRPVSIVASASGWTQYSVPTEMGDAKYIVILNPSTNTYNVALATLDGSSNKVTTDTLVPGGMVLLSKRDKTKIYLNHAGASGTQEVDVFALET